MFCPHSVSLNPYCQFFFAKWSWKDINLSEEPSVMKVQHPCPLFSIPFQTIFSNRYSRLIFPMQIRLWNLNWGKSSQGKWRAGKKNGWEKKVLNYHLSTWNNNFLDSLIRPIKCWWWFTWQIAAKFWQHTLEVELLDPGLFIYKKFILVSSTESFQGSSQIENDRKYTRENTYIKTTKQGMKYKYPI